MDKFLTVFRLVLESVHLQRGRKLALSSGSEDADYSVALKAVLLLTILPFFL